jgi:hypothetical protein
MTTPPLAADTTLEDLILPALAALWPVGAAWWGVAPAGTVERLWMDPLADDYLVRFWVAQFQAGFSPAHYVNSAGLSVPVVVRCYSATEAAAREGRGLAVGAMQALPRVVYRAPVRLAPEPNLYSRADLWEVAIR